MCFLVRMKFGRSGDNDSRRVWEEGFVGVWYGAWQPEDIYSDGKLIPRDKALSVIEASGVNSRHAATALRFAELPAGTWVLTHFDQLVAVAQLRDSELVVLPHFLREKEPFKGRRIANQKIFKVGDLPPSYRLLRTAGRGNIHRIPSCPTLLRLLLQSADEAEVHRKFDDLVLSDWINALGPKGWESLCLGYLVQQYGFLPTGLSVGGTLADFDIIGRFRSGERVYGQCKGSQGFYTISPSEKKAFLSVNGNKLFFFARGGVAGEALSGVEVLTEADIIGWLNNTDRGREYRDLLLPRRTGEG